ncbi:uncharacterized protein K452DRAFT_268178 [Aplosporella prunicola CBS 121167]|uniref:Thioredoxin domain-containing protein n=1 Tax=Aplosporella prunicola CBS 121167 TaxID=1176127 RepID=A0A6A6BKH3_9PEZI|nr:uncharacterized protein K452DRAFT_268178 [Aplosporella prunicola CBS 121167]KAF2143784.1 hypothetical protein K452DRAFT_268178 [Aplosporella prunicola CBS 121167]
MTLSRPLTQAARLTFRFPTAQVRRFASTPPAAAKNRVYTSVRTPDELHTLLLLGASSRKPLITLWTASWCASCHAVEPLLRQMIEDEGVGESVGGVGYAQVEVDAVTIGDLPITYRINSMPTLLAFDRQEAQFETKVTRLEDLESRRFLTEWIEKEARRGGEGGGGGSLLGKWFG